MRAYVTILDRQADLLPYFVGHYRRLGASVFPITVYGRPEENAATMAAAIATVEAAGGRPLPLGTFDERKFTARRREAWIASRHPAGQWAFFCDLDEFAEGSGLWAQGSGDEPPYIYGQWLDRLAPGGRLIDVDPARPLEEQFPLAGHLRRNQCYVLSPFAPASHHPQACRLGRGRLHQAKKITVHHFKWQANVIARLRRRLERIAANGQEKSRWAANVRRQIAALEAGVSAETLDHVGSVLGI